MTEEVKLDRHGRPMKKDKNGRWWAGGRTAGPSPEHRKFQGVLWHMRRAYSVAVCQARFRGEPWDFAWEDYIAIWEGKWHLRGRLADDYIFTRRDWSKPWNKENCIVQQRKIHLQRNVEQRTERQRQRRAKNATNS